MAGAFRGTAQCTRSFLYYKGLSGRCTSLNTNLHPFRYQYAPGPWTFGLDASVFKAIPITERVVLRFNADFFNVLNNPGLVLPGTDGIVSLVTSGNTPRQLQLTLRLSW